MKTLGFVLLEPFSEWECAYLASGLRMLAGDEWETKFLSRDGAAVRSIGGMTVLADGDLSVMRDLEALAVVGGLGWRTDAASCVGAAVREFAKTGRPLGAICDAVGFFGSLELLNARQHTGNGPDEIIAVAKEAYKGSDLYVAAQAVRDRGLITANGTGALEFAREFLLELGVDETKVEEWYQFHKLGFCAVCDPSATPG